MKGKLVLFLAFLFACASSAIGEDDKKQKVKEVKLPKSFDLMAPRRSYDKAQQLGSLNVRCSEIRLSEFGPKELWASLDIDYLSKPEKDIAYSHDGETRRILALSKGVFPLGPHLYRVAEFKIEGKYPRTPEQANEGVVRLERVDEEWAMQWVPRKDSFVMPYPGGGTLHTRGITVMKIFEQNGPEGSERAVRIELLNGKEPTIPTLVLKEGETLDLENAKTGEVWRHRLRRIVPDGFREGTQGWVEFDLAGVKIKEGKEEAKPK